MRFKLLLFATSLGFFGTAHAQNAGGIGIGITTPDASAALDISSSNLGLLVPRVALLNSYDGTTIKSPATSLLVYNTATTLGGLPGLSVNAGTSQYPNWTRLEAAGTNWSLKGNAGIQYDNFIGTTDNQSLPFRVNNREVARFEPNGSVTFGSSNQMIAIGSGAGSKIKITDYTYGQVLFIGQQAGANTTSSASDCLFIGGNAGQMNTASSNLFIGLSAGSLNTTGSNNFFIGSAAGNNNRTASYNHFVGQGAGSTATGNNNFADGYQAGFKISTGIQNHYSGIAAGANNAGSNNTMVGFQSGLASTPNSFITSNNNTFVGSTTGQTATGNANVFLGYQAGYNYTAGNNNIFIGATAGNSGNGSNNLYIGYNAGNAALNGSTRNNATAIGWLAKVDQDNSLILGGTGSAAVKVGIGTTTPGYQLTVVGDMGVIGPSGSLYVVNNITAGGTITQNSDRRLKTNVRPLTDALASVNKLRGVRYTFLPGKGPQGEQIGVIAQEIEALYPELVRTDVATGIKSVNYAQLTPVLLEAIKELQGQLAQSQSQVKALSLAQGQTTASVEQLRQLVARLEAEIHPQASAGSR